MTHPTTHTAPTFRQELNATGRLALPLAGAMLAQMGMGLTDTVLLGSIGRDALAAGGLAGTMFFVIAGVFQYAISSVAILIAHARGSGNTSEITDVLRAGYVYSMLAALPLCLALWNIEPLLLWIGEPPPLAKDIAAYVQVIVIGAPAALLMATKRFYLSAMNHPRIILWIAILGLIVNGFLDYGLIYGLWNLPELGYLGPAAATAIVLWLTVAMTTVAIWLTPDTRPDRVFGPINWNTFRELMRLGWPIAVIFSVETMLFAGSALMIGTLGSTALAAHQVAIMIAATSFMVPMAIGQAANVRIGYHLGASMSAAARQAGITALLLGMSVMSMSAVIIFLAPRGLALLFQLNPDVPSDADVIALVVQLLMICALFQIFDGAQAIGAGILRGYKDTRVPMLLATSGYWVIGFPVAWVLGFPLGLGAIGVWCGLATGLAAAAVMLCGRFFFISRRMVVA